MFAASKSGSVAEATDAQFNYVTMLLHGDGTNGAQNNTFLDSSTNNFTITRNGNTTQGTFTPYGSNWSNYFSGTTGQFLNAPANAAFNFGTGDFTVEGFVYPTSTSGTRPIVEIRTTGGANGFALLSQSGATTLNIFTNSGFVGASTNSLITNQWNHFALTRSGNTWTYWINGVSGGSFTNTSTQSDGATTGPKIGGSTTSGEVWVGYLSNIRIVKGTCLYTSTFTPSATPLTAISGTSLLTCADNRFIDDSTNNFTITVNGSPSVQRFSPFVSTTAYSTSVIGGSGYFDGSGDYLTAPSTSGQLGSGNFTIECWSYLKSKLTLYPTLWGNYTSFGAGSLGIFAGHDAADTTKYNIAINGTFPAIQSTASIIYNQWTHIALVRSGTTVTLYVNGVANGTATSSATLNGTSGTTYIGTAGDSIADGYINGYLTDSRVLVGTALYTAAFTPPTAPLTAITNTRLLLNYTNAGILDNAMMNDLETVGNAQISTSVKKYGTGSLAFDGTGDALYSNAQPNAFNTGDFTLEFWIYFNAVNNSTTKFVYDMRNSGATSASFLAQETDNSWTFWNGAGTQISTGFTGSTFSATTWTHVAICRSSGVTKFFVNGTQTNSVADTSNYANSTIVVGSRYNYANGLNAYIDDLRLTKGVARYTASFTAPTTAFADKG
jgi:hypothetical protein